MKAFDALAFVEKNSVVLAKRFTAQPLTVIVEEHTPSGAHENVYTPFSQWVTRVVRAASTAVSKEETLWRLDEWMAREKTQPQKKKL